MIEIIPIKIPIDKYTEKHAMHVKFGSTEFITRSDEPISFIVGKNMITIRIEFSCLQCKIITEEFSENNIIIDIFKCKTRIDRIIMPINSKIESKSGGVKIEFTSTPEIKSYTRWNKI